MLISELKYRSIASQNILSYSANININNTTGISSFGLSGGNSNLNLFTFKTGKIYDVNNRHVWSYNPSENITISGNINTGDHHYYINNNLICLSSPKENVYYQYLYANSENSTMNFDINIIGNNQTSYSVTFPLTYTMGDNITGFINNNSEPSFSFQLFTGKTFGQPYYSLSSFNTQFISGARSGQIVLRYTSALSPDSFNSGAGEIEPLNGNLSLSTNFGEIIETLNIPINKRPYYFIDLAEIFTGTVANLIPSYNAVYELRTKSPSDQTFAIRLLNSNGYLNEISTGAFPSTGIISNPLSGFIHGFNDVTGLLTGTVTSLFEDFYGNFLNESASSFTKQQLFATGFIDYYYNVPILGGSGLFTAEPGTLVSATGYTTFTGSSFIYESRLITTATKTGLLTGNWFQHPQTGTGLLTLFGTTIDPEEEDFENGGVIAYFTGVNNVPNIHFDWKSLPYLGFDYENYNKNFFYKIYGITGSTNLTFRTGDSGVLRTGISTQQRTGSLINYIFRLNSDEISNISGEVFDSEGSNNAVNVFSTNLGEPWTTPPSISTGYLGFQFKNFNPIDSGIVQYYELSLDRNFSNYRFVPEDFKLQGSNNNILWTDMDRRSGMSTGFYHSQSNTFQVSGTGNYNYVQLLITSGKLFGHLNQNTLDDSFFGLSINKIYFYEKTVSENVTGLYKNFIDNDATGNSFFSSFNTGVDPDSFFSNDETSESENLYYVSQLDKLLYPYVELTGGIIGYQTPYVYTGNKITGFFIDFEPGFSPNNLKIEISNLGSTYSTIYNAPVTNNIQSGLFATGVVITNLSTGPKFFRFNLKNLPPEVDFGSESATCVTGWKAAAGDTFPIRFPWTDVALSNNAGKALLTTNFTSGTSPRVTGFIFQNSQGYNQNFVARNFTGRSELEVQIKSIAFDKNNGRHVLFCRNGINFYTGAVSPDPTDFKIRYNSNFLTNPAQTRATGFDGAWTDVAISHDGRVMAAVGLYDFDRHPVTIQISLNTGLTWTENSDLGTYSLGSISMSSGGNVMYATPFYDFGGGTFLCRSVNSGVNWDFFRNFSEELRDVATDDSGKYIIVAGNGYIHNSEDSGVTWSSYGGVGNWQKVAMSNDGRYQLATAASVGSTVRSDDYGVNWVSVTGLNAITVTSAAISSNGKFQYVVPSDTGLYNNCTFGYDLPTVNEAVAPIRVKKLNLYTSREKDFFDLNPLTVTGFGNTNFLLEGFGTGFLTNPTGLIYFPALSYVTGRLTGTVPTDEGSFLWEGVSISSTGSPGRVFVDRTTGIRNASGIIRFNMSLITGGDSIQINGVSFFYNTGLSDSYYQFDTLTKLINVLNSGATGALDDDTLQNFVGVTGSLISEMGGTTMRLFSHNPSGEGGNNTKLVRSVNNLGAIQIPSRYLVSGQTLRPLLNIWEGNFADTLNFTVENTGIYTITPQEFFETNISGVTFENNFYPNWSAGVTPISEGIILNTGLTVNLTPITGFGRIRQFETIGGYETQTVSITKSGFKYFPGEPNETVIHTAVVGYPFHGRVNPGSTAGISGKLEIYTGISGSWALKQLIIGGYTNPIYGNGVPNSGVDTLGTSVDLTNDGSVIIAGGATRNSFRANGNGAMIFTGNPVNGWNLVQKISGNSQEFNVGGYFGECVSIGSNIFGSAGYVAVGRPGNNSLTTYSGNGFPLRFSAIISGERYGIRPEHEYGKKISIDKMQFPSPLNSLMIVGTLMLGDFVHPKPSGFVVIHNRTGELTQSYNFNRFTLIGSSENPTVGGYIGGYQGSQILVSIGGYASQTVKNVCIGITNSGNRGFSLINGFTDRNTENLSLFRGGLFFSEREVLLDLDATPDFRKIAFTTKNFTVNGSSLNVYNIINDSQLINEGSIDRLGLPSKELNSGPFVSINSLTTLVSDGIYEQNQVNQLTGTFIVKAGLAYLGYSGLNIDSNKRLITGNNIYGNGAVNLSINSGQTTIFSKFLKES